MKVGCIQAASLRGPRVGEDPGGSLCWRRRGDSNPRSSCPDFGFQVLQHGFGRSLQTPFVVVEGPADRSDSDQPKRGPNGGEHRERAASGLHPDRRRYIQPERSPPCRVGGKAPALRLQTERARSTNRHDSSQKSGTGSDEVHHQCWIEQGRNPHFGGRHGRVISRAAHAAGAPTPARRVVGVMFGGAWR